MGELPAYFTEPDWKKNKKRSKKQEKKVASLASGFLVPGSGSGRFKGDVQSKEFKIECKTTEKDSISLKLSWLRKIEAEALSDAKTPVLSIEIGDTRYYVLREQEFEDYVHYRNN
jgi:hypothetical protein